MTRKLCQRVVCLVAFGFCMGSWCAAVASVDGKRSAERQVALQVRQPLQGAQLLVRWRPVANRKGGQFLLYRGTDRDSLQRVASLAVDNSNSYEVADSAAWEGRRIYQLRYLDRHGRERVLTTVLLDLSHVENHEILELAAGTPQPLESALSRPLQSLDFHNRLPPVDARAPVGGVPAPPAPPPRSADTTA